MNQTDQQSDVKKSDLEAAAEIRGRKLGFLLAASTLPEDVKDELAALALEMGEEGQDRLLELFEAKYLNEASSSAEGELKSELEKLVKKYQAEDEAAAKDLAASLSQI